MIYTVRTVNSGNKVVNTMQFQKLVYYVLSSNIMLSEILHGLLCMDVSQSPKAILNSNLLFINHFLNTWSSRLSTAAAAGIPINYGASP